MNHSPKKSQVYHPLSSRRGPLGNLSITTFNLYNLFEFTYTATGPTLPEVLATKIAKLVLAWRYELLLPQIVAVQEVESEQLLQKVADAVNEAAGTSYRALSPPCSDRRGIQVGLLWDTKRVELIRAYQLSSTAVSAAFGPDSPSPGREPLVGLFRFAGRELTIVANHFKSDYKADIAPADQKRLLHACFDQRRAQARVVRDFANTLLAEDSQALLLVAGDMNQTPPTLAEADAPDGPLSIIGGSPAELPLTNLLLTRPDRNNYTFISDGLPVILDHIFASPALMAYFVAADALHFNVAYPDIYQSDPSTACRVSDHDPLEARFSFDQDANFSSSRHLSG